MPPNSPEYQRAYKQKHYAANKAKYIAQSAARKQILRNEVNELKSTTPCMDCGIQYPYWVMDFDHREDTLKVANVSHLVAGGQRKKALEEIAKCDVVCANCHRQRTQTRVSPSGLRH